MSLGKTRWGDTLDEDDEDEQGLPPMTETGPDERGIKTRIEYKRSEDTNATIKVTSKIRISKTTKRVSEQALRRRSLEKFGAAATQKGDENITMNSNEDVFLERKDVEQKTESEKKIDNLQQALASQDKNMVVGSLRDMLYKKRMERQLLAARGLIDAPEKAPDDDDAPSGLPSRPGGYVPPSLRAGGAAREGAEPMRRMREENSIRVTNLSEDTREQDLHELFGPFGPISRIYNIETPGPVKGVRSTAGMRFSSTVCSHQIAVKVAQRKEKLLGLRARLVWAMATHGSKAAPSLRTMVCELAYRRRAYEYQVCFFFVDVVPSTKSIGSIDQVREHQIRTLVRLGLSMCSPVQRSTVEDTC
eukprot:scaffold1883_cov396-Prasinococcus_capsulatus_cf.AAC.25